MLLEGPTRDPLYHFSKTSFMIQTNFISYLLSVFTYLLRLWFSFHLLFFKSSAAAPIQKRFLNLALRSWCPLNFTNEKNQNPTSFSAILYMRVTLCWLPLAHQLAKTKVPSYKVLKNTIHIRIWNPKFELEKTWQVKTKLASWYRANFST